MSIYLRQFLSNITVSYDFHYLFQHSIICLLVFSFYANFHPADPGVLRAWENYNTIFKHTTTAMIYVEKHTGWEFPDILKSTPESRAKHRRDWQKKIREMPKAGSKDWIALALTTGFIFLWCNRWIGSETFGTVAMFTVAMGVLELVRQEVAQ